MSQIVTRDELKGIFEKRDSAIRNDLNQVIKQFQEELVTTTRNVNLAWNAMNAVLKALVDKGLVSEENIVAAGREMHAQFIAFQKGIVEQQKSGIVSLVPKPDSPINDITEAVFRKQEDGAEDGSQKSEDEDPVPSTLGESKAAGDSAE